jgi:hypothetical protein
MSITIDAKTVDSTAPAGLPDNKIGVQAIKDNAEIVATNLENCLIIPSE